MQPCRNLTVRYNPAGDRARNRRQSARLKQLSDYLHKGGRLYMFELLVPPEKAQLDQVKGDKGTYDLQVRPGLMVQAIHRRVLEHVRTLSEAR